MNKTPKLTKTQIGMLRAHAGLQEPPPFSTLQTDRKLVDLGLLDRTDTGWIVLPAGIDLLARLAAK